MSDQQSSHEPQSMKIQLEVVPENAQEADIADIDEVGQSLVDELRNNGYTVNPTYTGKKGAPLFEILVPIAQFLHDNKDWLLAILSTVSPVLQFIQKERDR